MAPTFLASTRAEGLASSMAVALPAGTVSGDFQLVVLHAGSDSETVSAAPSGWTLIASAGLTGTNTSLLRVYSSTTATGTATFSKSGSRAYHIWRGTWRNHNGMQAGSASATYTGTNRVAAWPSKTAASQDSTVIVGGVNDLYDFNQGGAATLPATVTSRYQQQNSHTNEDLRMVVADAATTTNNQSVAGSFTFASTTNNYIATFSLVLTPGYLPKAASDAGVGSDEITVAKTLMSSVADAALGTDTLWVDRDTEPLVDSALGTDEVSVEQLVLRTLTDSGVGTDAVEAAVFKGNDLAEQGVGSDAITMDRLQYNPVVDQGLGSDDLVLRQDKNPTDQGVGSDSIANLGMPGLVDGGVGTDEITIVNIPYTQVLKRTSGATAAIYDLVVMARIPQASGEPAFVEINPIEWKSLTYVNALSTAQDLTATCQISSVTEEILQRLRALHDLATELWLMRDGQIVFAGPLVGYSTSGETLTLRASGLLAYLKLMVVTSDQKFVNVDQFAVVKKLIDQWQSLPYGHFGIDTTSIGASGYKLSATYLRDELHNVGTKIEEMGKAATGFDVEVDPASRKLQLWYPGRGIDRSSGEDAIVFDGRNVTSSDIMCSVAIGDLASEAFGTATATGEDTTLYATASNPTLRARYGRSGVTSTYTDISQQAVLASQVQGLLDARAEALMVPGPKVRVTVDADLGDYGVGDTVSYDFGSQLGVSGAFRIRKQSVSAAPTGQESVDLEFV